MAIITSPFTASRTQVATYLFGVALFSISFLVFLNASVSFVITDLIGQDTGVGDAVGSLGFADELVALVACPLWGILSDRVGVRAVCVIGYAMVGLSLFVFVQADVVYPQLLLARIFFSIGGAATSTMVTAVLPTMTFATNTSSRAVASTMQPAAPVQPTAEDLHPTQSPSAASETTEATLTPERYHQNSSTTNHSHPTTGKSGTSQVAGLVGTFTGLGALLALGIFLPLPARFSKAGYTRAEAVRNSFYIVGSIAFLIAIVCFFGLRNLPTEGHTSSSSSSATKSQPLSSLSRVRQAIKLATKDTNIPLAFLGGFVARASSVGISLFIPLFINAYFIRSGLCPSDGSPIPGDPSDVKQHCRRAYTLAAALSGASQVVALVCAPLFGYVDGLAARRGGWTWNSPLMFAAACGVVGYSALANVESPIEGVGVWGCMVLLGISQIGSIVCSLASLGRGVDGGSDDDRAEIAEDAAPFYSDGDGDEDEDVTNEQSPLLPPQDRPQPEEVDGLVVSGATALRQHHVQSQSSHAHISNITSRAQLKGTLAGLYSLSGGAGILLLTKLGGYLFDTRSAGAPFVMLAVFNGVLLGVTACVWGVRTWKGSSPLR